MHIVTIVDFWQNLTLQKEKTVKQDIIEFLDRHPETMIVNACYDLVPRSKHHPRVIQQCDPMLIDYLKANPHRHLDVDIMDIQWTHEIPWSTYTICGFHAGWWQCIMERPIALYQMMKHHPNRHQDIILRYDLACTDQGKYVKMTRRRLVRRMGFPPESPLTVVYKSQ